MKLSVTEDGKDEASVTAYGTHYIGHDVSNDNLLNRITNNRSKVNEYKGNHSFST